MQMLWPFGMRAAYERDVATLVPRTTAADDTPIAEPELEHLPVPVQRYLRLAGVVGRPRVRTFAARMHGRIRSGPAARWLPIVAEQHNVVAPAARLFYFDGTMAGVPLQGYHRYVDGSASMVVRLAGLLPVARASGPELTRAETVTLFNDMCVLAPATLVSPGIVWEPGDARTARARFANAGYAIAAELFFGAGGELVDFRSDDRCRAMPDGRFAAAPWSTPLGACRSFGPARLAATGEGWWHGPEGAYAYIELTIDFVRYDVRP